LPSNLQNGLVGYWPFCGDANDESGNGNDGTVNGATLTEDRFGMANAAYNFNGLNQWIEVPPSSELNISQSVTVSAWVKKNEFNQRFEALVIKDQSILSTQGINYKLQLSPNNDIDFYTSRGYTSVEFPDSNWSHFVGVSTNDSIKFYLDNNLIYSSVNQFNGNPLTTNDLPLTFGRLPYDEFDEPNTAGNERMYYKGTLDDIGIWNRALSPDEVQQLYTLNACTFSIYDTTYVTIYDTVSVSTTDTLIINTLITGVQPAQENTFLVYPNPTGSQITINNGNVSILGGYTMRISNSIGQEVYNQNITQTEVTLDLSNWGGNGLYVLYILDPQQNIVAVKQIVLQ
jgi:hypothetical protein